MLYSMQDTGDWSDDAGTNLLDTGAPYYDVYPCADGRFLAVGALEPQFFAVLAELLELDPAVRRTREDPATWPELRQAIASALAAKDRDMWVALAGTGDACVAPVLTLTEARENEHLRARGVFGAQAMPRLPLATGGPDPRVDTLVERWSLPPEVGADLDAWARDTVGSHTVRSSS
jgi:alpha-methylacyl-CoA racemase